MKITISFWPEALEFLNSIPAKDRAKIYFNLAKIQQGFRDNDLFKKLTGTDIWEIRTLFNSTCYRLFAFWDSEEESLIVATHGIIKKTQKTPAKEITKAEDIRRIYYDEKRANKQ